MERILNELEIDTVSHFAAQAIVTIANRGPLCVLIKHRKSLEWVRGLQKSVPLFPTDSSVQ